MMSTRCSLLITGVLTAALSVVGFVGDVTAQTALSVAASPIEIGEPASASSTAPYSTVTVTYKAGTTAVTSDVNITLVWGGIATLVSDYSAGHMPLVQDGVTIPGSGTATLAFKASTASPIAAGASVKSTWRVTAMHDDSAEGDEQLNVVASSGVLQGVAVITITDNDDPGISTLTTSVNKSMLMESDADAEDTTKGVVEFTVSTSSGQTFTTDQRIQLELGGDATKGDDYTIDKEVLTLEAGLTMVKAKITVVDDMVYDGRVNETISVTAYVDSVRLSSGGSNGTHTIQIEDNDQNPEDFEVTISPAMIMEGEVATLTVTAAGDVDSARTFTLMLAGTATENSDYTIPSELIIPKDTKTGSVQLQAVMDGAAEMDESVMITVMAGGVMIGTVQTVTITDVMATPALPIFGAFALGVGLFAAGRARLRRRQALRAGQTRGQLTR